MLKIYLLFFSKHKTTGFPSILGQIIVSLTSDLKKLLVS
jgi:hypothetical protein